MSKVENGKGFVYILKDDHFKRGVKIGRAHNVAKRIRPMLTANPWLSVYIKVETSKWKELEKALHNVIKLIAKTKQVKNSEFYMIEPEKAKKIMLQFASLFSKDDFKISTGDDVEIVVAPKPKAAKKAKSHAPGFRFPMVGIKPNAKLIFVPTGASVRVVDDKRIEAEGTEYTLSGYCKAFMPAEKRRASEAYQGPKYFSFKGRVLTEIRRDA